MLFIVDLRKSCILNEGMYVTQYGSLG